MTLTFLGDVVISLILTLVADRIGRKRMLALGSLSTTANGVVFAIFSQYLAIVRASVLDVVSPSGNGIGPFNATEESTVFQLVKSADRSSVLASYLLSGTAGAASGTITFGEGVPTHFLGIVYAVLGLVKFGRSLTLACEIQKLESEEEITDQPKLPKSKRYLKSFLPEMSTQTAGLLLNLCFLFGIDSPPSGAASTSWLVFFFHDMFGLQEGNLGSLFFFTNILSSALNLAAASLAKRIGFFKRMISTHLPGSLALVLLPLPSNEAAAMALLLLRSGIAKMDQAPRHAIPAAAVLPVEKTVVMGIVNVAKTLSQSGRPILNGLQAQVNKIGIALVCTGALKCSYDILMLSMFLGYQTIDEKAESQTRVEIEKESKEIVDHDHSQT